MLQSLPAPDAVFIGGSGGALESVIETVLQKNASARLCISAVTLETLSDAVTACGLDAEVCQIAVSRTRKAGDFHLLTAQNPVFLITSKGGGVSDASKGGGV